MAFRKILVAIDGGERSERAFGIAASLAMRLGARLTAVHAIALRAPSDMSFLSEASLGAGVAASHTHRAREAKELVESLARKAGIECSMVVEEGAPWETILRVAEKRGCDLIVMATRGRRGASALLIGSETQEVIVHARMPVLVCR